MRTLFGLLILLPFSSTSSFASTPSSIKVNGKSCSYTILVPENWDVIPNDTLTKRFGKGTFDLGVYNLKNKSYFEGEFVQYLFLPTLNPLNQLSFTEIIKKANSSFDFEKKSPKRGKTYLETNNFRVDKEKFVFYLGGRIISEKKERICTQSVLLTKFGFLKVLYYDAVGKSTHNTSYDNLLTKVSFPENFKYTEPTSKISTTILNVIIAFVIGLIVYFGILYFSKIKQLFSKQ